MKPDMKGNARCCLAWKLATDNIRVTPRDVYNPQDKLFSEALEAVLTQMMGNYCPICGKKLTALLTKQEGEDA